MVACVMHVITIVLWIPRGMEGVVHIPSWSMSVVISIITMGSYGIS